MPRGQNPEYTAQSLEQRAQTPEPRDQSQEPAPQARKHKFRILVVSKLALFLSQFGAFLTKICTASEQSLAILQKKLYVIVVRCLDSTTRVANEAAKPEHMATKALEIRH